MGVKFGNLVNPLSSISSGFEKGIEFIKTEKELHDNIGIMISKMDKRIAGFLGIKKELMTLIGAVPTREQTHYGHYNNLENKQEEISYMTYDVTGIKELKGECEKNCDETAIDVTPYQVTNLTVESEKEDDHTLQMKLKYNEICNTYWRTIEKRNDLFKMKRNLNENGKRNMKLSLYELDQYGF